MNKTLAAAAAAGNPLARQKLENSRLLRAEIAAGKTTLRGLPEIVTFNSTDICNLRCIMCPRHEAQGKYHLDDALLRLVADELFPTALKVNLTTAGGEPLGVGFDTILDCARRHEVRMDVVTNGMLMDVAKFRAMRPYLDHLNVSVDCSVPAIYEKIRLGASFDKLVERLSMVAEHRRDGTDDMIFSLSAVVMASNLPHLADLVRFAAKYGAHGVVLQLLRHEVRATKDEEPTRFFSPAEIDRHLTAAENAAREVGINLAAPMHGRPPVWVRPIREKVPSTIDGAGVCYFLSQSFSVMYTGEVYPCCKPTDYLLGDVRYQSPFEIWNGEPLRRLREAHYSKKGTLFCSGCEYAPHLPKRRAPMVQERLKLARRLVGRLSSWNTRRQRANDDLRSDLTTPPAHLRIEGAIVQGAAAAHVEALAGARDACALDPRDGSAWFVSAGRLWRSATVSAAPREVATLADPERRAATLAFVRPGVLLLSFEGSGTLQRVDTGSCHASAEVVLRLSDERAFVRAGGISVHRDGGVWLGEYGVAPGLRCAVVYRSLDGGKTFEQVGALPAARHVHSVFAASSNGHVIVTTGDLGMERATYTVAVSGNRYRRWLAPWSGFTGVAESEGFVHFGTDLESGNGMVRVALGEGIGTPEFRPFPSELDLQVRQIESCGEGRLVALCALDENLGRARATRRACVLTSEDAGGTWQVRHRFAEDWSDAPERFVLLSRDPVTLATDCVDRPRLLRL